MFECISTLEKVRRDMDDNIYNFTKDENAQAAAVAAAIFFR